MHPVPAVKSTCAVRPVATALNELYRLLSRAPDGLYTETTEAG